MDEATRSAYESGASSFAAEWEDEQDAPTDLYDLLTRYFSPGTVFDIGCGSGRDAAWLSTHGFDVTGYDASARLIDEARRRHPQVRFDLASLPGLPELGMLLADNVLCETVLMHLPVDEVSPATSRLYTLLKPGGVLYLSWRVTMGGAIRDGSGRLYSSFPPTTVRDALPGAVVLYDAEQRSASSGKVIHRIIVRRPE